MRKVFNYALCFMNCALITSCSQDDTLTQDNGKTPIVLSATGISLEGTTRSTIDGNWEGVSTVGLYVNYSEECTGTVTQGSSNTKVMITPSTALYWENYYSVTKTSVAIEAWYPTTFTRPVGDSDNNSDNNTVMIASDQSTEAKMISQDLIYACNTAATASNNTLTFNHLLARVVINLKTSDYLTTNKDNVSVKLMAYTGENGSWICQGKYEYDTKGMISMTSGSTTTQEITPCTLSSANSEYFASYEVLIVPQSIDNKCIAVQVGNATYKWQITQPSGSYEGGTMYTYDITVTPTGISVTNTNSISWTTGSTGSGTVTMQ